MTDTDVMIPKEETVLKDHAETFQKAITIVREEVLMKEVKIAQKGALMKEVKIVQEEISQKAITTVREEALTKLEKIVQEEVLIMVIMIVREGALMKEEKIVQEEASLKVIAIVQGEVSVKVIMTVREGASMKVMETDQEDHSLKTVLIVPVVLLVKTTIFQEEETIQENVSIITILLAVVSNVNARILEKEVVIMKDRKVLFSEVLLYQNQIELMADPADQELNAKVVLIMVRHLAVLLISLHLILMYPSDSINILRMLVYVPVVKPMNIFRQES